MNKAEEILKDLNILETNFDSLESGEYNDNNKITFEYMRKFRFESIRHKFAEITKKADEVIKSAKMKDIIMFRLFVENNKVLVISAKIVNEKMYADMAFG